MVIVWFIDRFDKFYVLKNILILSNICKQETRANSYIYISFINI
jgi:hypothetical protein